MGQWVKQVCVLVGLGIALFMSGCGSADPAPPPPDAGDPVSSCPGVSCGNACCTSGQQCVEGACVTCSCEGRSCGDDGCGNSCGSCGALDHCVGGSCEPCLSNTAEQLCAEAEQACGPLTVTDDCGQRRMVDCGVCYTPKNTSATFHFGYSGPAFTCEQKCGEAGHAFCTDCANGDAGTAIYQYTSGSFTSNKTRPVATCDASISPTYVEFGTTYRLYYFQCCCMTTQRVVEGNVAQPQSCTAVCAAQGMACNPEAEWALGDKGGQQVTYRRTADPSYRVSQLGCDTVPELERTQNGRHEVLDKQECGCR